MRENESDIEAIEAQGVYSKEQEWENNQRENELHNEKSASN